MALNHLSLLSLHDTLITEAHYWGIDLLYSYNIDAVLLTYTVHCAINPIEMRSNNEICKTVDQSLLMHG